MTVCIRSNTYCHVHDQACDAFNDCLPSLKDGLTHRRLLIRLRKASIGNLGDVKPVGSGVFEMRLFFGPGWRMYDVQRGSVLIVMLGGGVKSTQRADIAAAQALVAILGELFRIEKIQAVKIGALPEFDFTEHLDSEQAIAEYLSLVLEDGDSALLAAALGDIAKARGMTQVAKDAGTGRESLYKVLRAGAQPRFDTVQRACKALGLKVVVQVAG